MRHHPSPRLLMILSMAVFGTLGPFVRYIPLASAELAMWRAITAALLIGLVLLLRKTRIAAGALRSTPPWLLLSGAAMGVNWILLFEAYRYTTVSAATLSYIDPLVAVIVSVTVPGKTMTLWQVIGGALILGFTLFGELSAASATGQQEEKP